MEQHFLGAATLVHVAGLLQVSGYLSRDQLILRALLFAGSCFYVAYAFESMLNRDLAGKLGNS